MKMHFHWIFIQIFTFGLHAVNAVRNIEEETGLLIRTEAVQGTLGRLPCNVKPPVPDDRVVLVIWYKEGLKKPIYSFDRRQSHSENGSHWIDNEILGKRAYFLVGSTLATLTIKNTDNNDTGIYRCRVDFQKNPTRNSRVELKVIIPPENLVILDDSGNHIPHYILGPYNEGVSINITCISSGGRPLPEVTWWHENTLLDDSSTALSDRRVSNVLEMSKLKRQHLNMQLTCQASNNNLTTPISSTVTLDMNLRPLIVKLQNENRPLSAENPYELNCDVIGSRPVPTVTWWKGSTAMKNTREIMSADGNKTTSILTFTPSIDDRGKFLSCRAEQALIPESGMEDGWKLDVYHVPVVTLELGTNQNSTLREGIDVFFECNIKSNPWIYKVSWRHNAKELQNNIAEGIIVANQSLVLQNVSRDRSGTYTCVGRNREGDGESNAVQLDIRYAPVCRPGQKTTYSAGRQETIKIICEIEANPFDLTFLWKFNSSATEYVDIAASLISTDRSRSIVHYTPMTEHDYGTLLCWSTNEIAEQNEPCIYTIIPAGEPDSLVNCTILNQTSSGFQVECVEGFDGGLEQDFIMEVYVNGTTRNPKISKSRLPFFEIRGLLPGIGYNVFLVAHNTKGRSNATILQVYTLKDPEKQTDLSLAYTPVVQDIRPFLGVLLGIVGSIMMVALVIVIVVRMRGSSGRDRNNYSYQNSRDTLHDGQSIQDVRMDRDIIESSSADSIDKNPDVVPQDDHDDDDEWITRRQNRAYTTAALAEQNAIMITQYDRRPCGSFDNQQKPNPFQQQQQQQHQQHHQPHQPHHERLTVTPQYFSTYNTLIPVSKVAEYKAQQNKNDLAHRTLYSSSSMFGGNPTISDINMSQSSHLASFSPVLPTYTAGTSINPMKSVTTPSLI